MKFDIHMHEVTTKMQRISVLLFTRFQAHQSFYCVIRHLIFKICFK